MKLIKKCKINGLAHITGGSFTKLLRLKNIGYEIDSLPKIPPIMGLIEEQGVKSEENVQKRFNMGVGFLRNGTKRIKSVKLNQYLKKHKIKSQEIGQVVSKKGVTVNSIKIA